MITDFISSVKELGFAVITDEPMYRHTTFGIGGKADVFVDVNDAEKVGKVISLAERNGIPYTVIGRGSNILVSDNGIEGAVLCISDGRTVISGNTVKCFAGASLTAVCAEARNNGLSGLEFAYGIPGSVGGAVFMNAGAYGGEIKDVLTSCTSVDRKGDLIIRKRDEMCLGYRSSIYKTNGEVIVSAEFCLKPGDKDEIKALMDSLIVKRKTKQPLEYGSAGSTFKRPEGYFAGALIEASGLKGFSVGGAAVSEKHAGFVINKGNATCSDVLRLIDRIKEKVYNDSGVELEPEVIFLGRK